MEFLFSYEQSFIKCILMIVHQHHYAIVHEHSYRLVHQQQKNPLHQQSRWWSGFFCRSWTCFLGPFLNKIVGQEPHLLVHEQLYGIVPELAFISRCWNPPNSLADYLEIWHETWFMSVLNGGKPFFSYSALKVWLIWYSTLLCVKTSKSSFGTNLLWVEFYHSKQRPIITKFLVLL